MRIEDLASKHANSLPGYTLVKYYEAAIPIYKVELNLTIQKKKELGIVEEFILKFAKEGICEITKLAKLLGLKRTVVNNYIALLINNELVAINIDKSKIRLTNKGYFTLSSMNLMIPEEIQYPLYVDGLTGKFHYTKRRYEAAKDIRRAELDSLSPSIKKPDMEMLTHADVNKAYKKFSNEHNDPLFDADLLKINDIEKTYLCYKKVNVLLFLNQSTDEMDLKVFEKANRVNEYEDIILKMQNDGIRQIKFDQKSIIDEASNTKQLFESIPKEIVESANELHSNREIYTKKIDDIEEAIKEQIELISTSKNDSSIKESSTQRVKELETELEFYKRKVSEGHKILNTYDHRPLLIKALNESKEKVVIVSPWIKRSGLNSEVMRLIEDAIKRQVKVYIGYGIEGSRDSDSRIISDLKELMSRKQYGKNLYFIELGNTHEKVLISDDDFVVVTSFNWLSFRGNPEWGFRQETGIYTESKTMIRTMVDNIQNRMGINIEN